MQSEFRKNLRVARQRMFLSQKECAQLLKIDVTTYRKYENTDQEPDFNTLIKIARLFKVSIDDLLTKTTWINYEASEKIYDSVEEELLILYRSLDDISKGTLLEKAAHLFESRELIYIVARKIGSIKERAMLSMYIFVSFTESETWRQLLEKTLSACCVSICFR